jgi:hypothetical protein
LNRSKSIILKKIELPLIYMQSRTDNDTCMLRQSLSSCRKRQNGSDHGTTFSSFELANIEDKVCHLNQRERQKRHTHALVESEFLVNRSKVIA